MIADDEEPLVGGFVNHVVRVGGTVRRTAGPWTPAVHALLRHLEARGFRESPRALGIDEQRREILTYLPGDAVAWEDWPPELLSSEGPAALGALLRRYYDAVHDYSPPEGAIWRNPLAPAHGEIIRHGDFSPFNTIWRDHQPVGVIDWDFAQPGTALDDLSYLAWYVVPLQGDDRLRQCGLSSDVSRSERIEAICDGYGGRYGPDQLLRCAVEVIERERQQTAELAASGLYPWTRFAADGAVSAFAREAAWINQHFGLV